MSKTEDFLSKADEQEIVQAIIEAEKTLREKSECI